MLPSGFGGTLNLHFQCIRINKNRSKWRFWVAFPQTERRTFSLAGWKTIVYCDVQSTVQGFTRPKQPQWKKSARFCANPRLPRKKRTGVTRSSWWTFVQTLNIRWGSVLCSVLWSACRNPQLKSIRVFRAYQTSKLKPCAMFGPDSLFWGPWLLPSNWTGLSSPLHSGSSHSLEWSLPSTSFFLLILTAKVQALIGWKGT